MVVVAIIGVLGVLAFGNIGTMHKHTVQNNQTDLARHH
jgi:hypothetical protein